MPQQRSGAVSGVGVLLLAVPTRTTLLIGQIVALAAAQHLTLVEPALADGVPVAGAEARACTATRRASDGEAD